MLKLIQN